MDVSLQQVRRLCHRPVGAASTCWPSLFSPSFHGCCHSRLGVLPDSTLRSPDRSTNSLASPPGAPETHSIHFAHGKPLQLSPPAWAPRHKKTPAPSNGR